MDISHSTSGAGRCPTPTNNKGNQELGDGREPPLGRWAHSGLRTDLSHAGFHFGTRALDLLPQALHPIRGGALHSSPLVALSHLLSQRSSRSSTVRGVAPNLHMDAHRCRLGISPRRMRTDSLR